MRFVRQFVFAECLLLDGASWSLAKWAVWFLVPLVEYMDHLVACPHCIPRRDRLNRRKENGEILREQQTRRDYNLLQSSENSSTQPAATCSGKTNQHR
jgi:hypothetical protein